MNDDDISDIDIDETWINEFKKNEELYDDFYKDKVEQIKLFYLYVSSTNSVESIKKDSILLDTDGILKKNKIIALILQNQNYNSIKYKLLSLIRFNIDIEPEQIKEFVYTTNQDKPSQFITSEKYLNDIKYSDTINIFQDLNCLYFIFYEEKPTSISISKSTIITNQNHQTKKLVSMTTNKHKKTRRRIIRI
jgi:hypothetical protein